MHRKWLGGCKNENKLQFYHPMISCLKQFVARLKGRESTERATPRIPLPFEMEIRFKFHLLKSVASPARVFYVHLRTPAKQQARTIKEADIEFE